MAFSETEKDALLTINGVGEKVIQRFEEIGIDSILTLSEANVDDVLYQIAALLNATCWKNNPQARASVNKAIQFAKDYYSKGIIPRTYRCS